MKSAKENLTTACYFLNIAKQMFEAAARDASFSRKEVVGGYVRRMKFIEDDILSKISDDENRALFRKEITASEADTLLFGNIVLCALAMTPEQRETLERLVDAIRKGEAIEIENLNVKK